MAIRNIPAAVILPLCLLAACAAPPETTLAPPPTLVQIQVPPALLPLLQDPIQECSQAQRGTTFLPHPAATLFPPLREGDLTVWWGPPTAYPSLSQGRVQAYQVGAMQISPAVHRDLPLQDLSQGELVAILTGKIQRWEDLDPDLPEGNITVLSYPEGNALRWVYLTALLGDRRLSPQALLLPHPEAMGATLADEPLALGYLPESLVGEETVGVNLHPRPPALRQPILGITAELPSPELTRFLACLDGKIEP